MRRACKKLLLRASLDKDAVSLAVSTIPSAFTTICQGLSICI